MSWQLIECAKLLGGTLPKPMVKNRHGTTISFLPCNPAKQKQYPTFIGYLFYKISSLPAIKIPVVWNKRQLLIKYDGADHEMFAALHKVMQHCREKHNMRFPCDMGEDIKC